MVALIIQLISGAVGGNIAGALLKKFDLGALGNSLAGILGGGLGGQLLGLLGLGGTAGAGGAGGLDIGAILSSVAGGGVGGGVLMAIIGCVRNMLAKKSS
jgi:hypothetical protein